MILNVILAVDQKFGIGIDGMLPWRISDELQIFREKTRDSVVICGRKTYEKLPLLAGRTVFFVSRSDEFDNDWHYHSDSIDDAIKDAKDINKPIFIIGGAQVYNYVFKHYKQFVKIHISFIQTEYKCDTYFDRDNLQDFYITNQTQHEGFKHCEMTYIKHGEWQYLNLLSDILENGERRVGRNGEVISDFCKHLKFDLRNGFPLLTSKKMFLKGIVEELLFFIRGDTNSKILEEKGIGIWKGNTSREFLDSVGLLNRPEGSMIPLYGYQWRYFNAKYDEKTGLPLEKGVDQLTELIELIKSDPTSRRLLLTSYNPEQVKEGPLFPCHSIILQFYVQDKFLDMFCMCRSQDEFLGTPFNIASSSLLLMIIAKLVNLIPRYMNMTQGDAHIYGDHVEAAKSQLERIPYTFPELILPEFTSLEEVEKLEHTDFKVENYKYYPSIKVDMVV